MKHLFGLAIGAFVAGAVVAVLTTRRARGPRRSPRRLFDTPLEYDRNYYRNREPAAAPPVGESMPTVLVADEQSVGEGSGDDRVELPDDGRIGQGQGQRQA